MNNLKDIHNFFLFTIQPSNVVLSGCQWTIWRIYTTLQTSLWILFSCFIRMSMNNLKDIHNQLTLSLFSFVVVLSGCQWTIWRIYTTKMQLNYLIIKLFYQDVNEQFEGYTQLYGYTLISRAGCFIRMSMNNLKDIHNVTMSINSLSRLFYQDVNEQFEGYTQP